MEAIRKADTAVAEQFVSARLKAAALPEFPGTLPQDLDAAYLIQDAAIDIFPDEIAGWKIGGIHPSLREALGAKTLGGPVFRKDVRYAAPGGTVEYGMYSGGFAAVEAEYMFEIAEDAPVGKTSYTTADAMALVKRMICGIETAGSPLATINVVGPLAVVSDFGNNNGVIIGPEVPNWRDRVLSELTCETFINGKSVGTGAAANIAGGPIEPLRFIAELCAKRGRPLKAGMIITTGAITGIHDVVPGELARVEFKGLGAVQCVATSLKARS
ncbi:2-keto-4-pentenoate hydratase [Rhizomicrobium palustre]|uniref:2-keto-4-pentenoate hydratase n=1 Tax=Rhizomicrobium palustre TaxID=189966 RepID=A0A846MX12_9PROT|nr:fumarylacetoacetate hydrolase family protein [Rhizomicrobium palustre]NIK87527.1 2-keto-4-pentenoate hydratase [Rhizomicrobium palustre]